MPRPRRTRAQAKNADTPQSPLEATAATLAPLPTTQETVTAAVQMSPEDERLARNAQILERLARGALYREIVAEFGVSFATVANIANAERSLEQGAVAKLMQGKALRMLELWEEAAESGAKAGKHAPAKEWLTHAKALEPVNTDSQQGAKVAIVIGMPGSPVGAASPQVITVQRVSGDGET